MEQVFGIFQKILKTGRASVEGDYCGLGARLYDLLQQGGRDIGEYIRLAHQYGGPALELGAGTGRIALEMARAGIDVTGVELSGDMLGVFREKLAQEPAAVKERVTLINGDMRDFEAGGPFVLALIPLYSLVHLNSTEDRVRTFRCILRHLSPGGRLVAEVEVPQNDPHEKGDEPHLRGVDYDQSTGMLVLTIHQSKTIADGRRLTNLLYVAVDRDGHAELSMTASVEQPVSVNQLEAEMRESGFGEVRVGRNFKGDEPRVGDTGAVVTAVGPC